MTGSTNAVVITGGETTGYPIEMEFTTVNKTDNTQISSFTCEGVE